MLREEIQGVRKWYNLIAPRFAARYEGLDGWYYRTFEEDVVLGLTAFEGRRVLDLGTGNGRFARRVSRLTALSVGVDISEELLRLARQSAEGRASFLQMDASRLGFGPASFDVVVSLGMFEYVKDPRPFLAEIRRVLKDGGKLIFTFHQVPSAANVGAEDPGMLYYGYTVAERERLWQKARHSRADFRACVEESGFRWVSSRRVFFLLPTRLFGVARRLAGPAPGTAARWAVSPLLGLAAATERLLGSVAGARAARTTGNVVVLAEKR